METSKLESIVVELQREEKNLRAGIDELRRDLKAREAKLANVQKAITSLNGKSSTSTNSQKLTASKEAVLTAMSEILRESGPLAKDELRSRVERHFSSQGIALTGFAMRFRSALKHERFSLDDDQVCLAKPNAQSSR